MCSIMIPFMLHIYHLDPSIELHKLDDMTNVDFNGSNAKHSSPNIEYEYR